MSRKNIFAIIPMICLGVMGLLAPAPPVQALNQSGDYTAVPPFLTSSVPPLVMLVMGRNPQALL